MKQDREAMQKFEAIPIPERLEEAVQRGLHNGSRLIKKAKKRSLIIRWTSAAATFAALFIAMAANPALAAKIPLLGHIFELFQEDYSYKGDFSSVAEPLEDNSVQNKEEKGDSQYSKTVNGTTVTLSELYCNDQALYMTMTIASKEAFPDTLRNVDGNPVLALETKGNFSFNQDTIHGLYYLEGDFTDAYTYAGILRINLEDVAYDATAFNQEVDRLMAKGKTDLNDGDISAKIEKIEIPEQFILNLEVTRIEGYKADTEEYRKKTEQMSEAELGEFLGSLSYPNTYENYWFDGSWNFALDIKADSSRTTIIEVNTTNDDGVGIASVEKTPFEIKLNELYPNAETASNYFPVALDADGDILPYGGTSSNVNILAIQDRDISSVDIYICDYDEYMDELKGYYWSEDYEENKKEKTFKELLDEQAVYHTQVSFDGTSDQ